MRRSVTIYSTAAFAIVNTAANNTTNTKVYRRPKAFVTGVKLIVSTIFRRSDIDIFFGIQSYVFAADIAAFDVDVFFSCGDLDIAVCFDCAALNNSCTAAGFSFWLLATDADV